MDDASAEATDAAFGPDLFTEVDDNGVRIPIDISGRDVGTRGGIYQFGNSSDLGEATAGLDMTANNMGTDHQVADTPTRTYPTFNPIDHIGTSTPGTMSEGNRKIAFVGDGINDIPAMREARLSAAPFTNLNLVTKDVDMLFTDETLEFIPHLFRLSKIRNHLSSQLLFYTILYNIIVVIIATSGIMSPFVAAIIMPLSSLISLYLVSRRFQTT